MSEFKRNFDPDQRAAIDVDLNAVVSAGAGSGKTTVLVERYARLVEKRGIGVDAILALTFTRKAAAEMNARIHARLSDSDDPRAAEQLALFDTARISTLDSFCGSIARGAAHHYGIPPDFAVDEVRLGRAADEISVELLMDRKEDPVLRRLVATMGFDRVRRSFFSRVATEHVSVARKPVFADEARRQVAALRLELSKAASGLQDACQAILDIDEDGGDSLAKAKSLVSSLLPLPSGADDESLAEMGRRAASLAGGDLRRPGAAKKPGLVLLKELIEPVKESAAAVKLLVDSYRLRDDIEAVGVLLDDLAQRFLERKRREGVLSFQDCAELATDILKRDGELRAYYKRRLKSILIDEFQDNNELQKDLLFLLAEQESIESPGIPPPSALCPDKLFFVGDEKQSIYRFRGADVSVFRRLSGELERAAGSSPALFLNANHRSSPELVAFFNALFPGVFGPAERDFEARFADVVSLKTPVADADAFPAAEFHLLEPPDPEDEESEENEVSLAAAEARAAAARIAAGVEAGEFAYSDVAVLFRSTSKQHEYERAFRERGIPYQASDPRGLFAEGPANDLYAVLRLCLFPQDRNAYAALLRSPFVRLGDESLARVLLDEHRAPFPEDAPSSWFSSASDAARFRRGGRIFSSIRADADLVGASELVARLWYDEGYLASLLSSGRASESADHFEKMYALALDADRRRIPLAAFLDELAPLMGSYEKIEGDEASDLGASAVRLMTVHKSKGLEFPVVLVADCGSDGRGPRNDQPFYVDAEYGIVANLKREDASRKNRMGNWFFERAKEEERARDLAELRRLLYVAATRAERKLLFFGRRKMNAATREALGELAGAERAEVLLLLPKRTAQGEDTEPKSFFDLIALGLSSPQAAGALYSVHSIDPGIERPGTSPSAENGRRAPSAAFYGSAPAEPRFERSRTVTPTNLETARRTISGPGPKPSTAPGLPIDPLIAGLKAESAFGTLCHLAVERALGAEPPRAEMPVDDCARLFPDLDAEARADIAETARNLAEGFLLSALGKKAVAAGRRRTEFPFLFALDSGSAGKPTVVNGKMDLVFELPSDNRCLIVDFKTDREIDPAGHAAQMACYRAAAAAFSDFPTESWLFYLRGGIALPINEFVDLRTLAEASLQPPAGGDDR